MKRVVNKLKRLVPLGIGTTFASMFYLNLNDLHIQPTFGCGLTNCRQYWTPRSSKITKKLSSGGCETRTREALSEPAVFKTAAVAAVPTLQNVSSSFTTLLLRLQLGFVLRILNLKKTTALLIVRLSARAP